MELIGNIFTITFMMAVIILCIVFSASLLSILESIIVQKYYEFKTRRSIKKVIHSNIKDMEVYINNLFELMETDIKRGFELAEEDINK